MRSRRITTIKKRSSTRDEETESRLTRLETNMEFVRTQVENHIPTTLAAQDKILADIQRRVGDMDAVSRFLSIVLKGLAAVGGLAWTWKNIMAQVHK